LPSISSPRTGGDRLLAIHIHDKKESRIDAVVNFELAANIPFAQ
jgi:hypothetical protein